MSTSLSKTMGVLFAPVVYTLGRLARRPELSSLSIDYDNYYLRGYVENLQLRDRPAEYPMALITGALLAASSKGRGDEIIKNNISRSRSQFAQDLVCLLVHEEKLEGYFVEVGVGDGTGLSNTILLEKTFGWGGILAEPAQKFHHSIRSNRTAKLDPRAVSNSSGRIVVFEEDTKLGELSGLAGLRSPREDQSIRRYDVETVTMDDLLASHDAPDWIDYVSIDTEGSEVQVLEGLSLDRRKVGLFTIEHNLDQPKLAKITAMLGKYGYRRIFPSVSSIDAWFVNADIDSKFI